MFAMLKAYAFQAATIGLLLVVTSLGAAYWIKSNEAEKLGQDNKVLITNNATLSGNVATLTQSVSDLNGSVKLLQTETENNSKLLRQKAKQDAQDAAATKAALAILEELAHDDPDLRTRFDARVPDAVYDFLFAPVGEAGSGGGGEGGPDTGAGPGRPSTEEGAGPAGEGQRSEGGG